jgi:hypothetical protein
MNPNDPDDDTSFEPDRCISLDHGRIVYSHIHYLPGKVVIGWIGDNVLPYHFEGEVLVIDAGVKPHWRRLKELPASLRGPTCELPKPVKLEQARIAAISKELLQRRVEDQAVRKDPKRAGDMAKVDQDNTAWLKKQVQEIGWIDVARFGKDPANAAFLIVQHSGDLPLMEAALPPIDADRKSKACDPQDFALLFDRVQIMNGRSQRYGSQIGQDKGRTAVYPLEDRAHLDQLRKDIGLFPMATYLDIYKKLGGGAAVVFMDDLLPPGITVPPAH